MKLNQALSSFNGRRKALGIIGRTFAASAIAFGIAGASGVYAADTQPSALPDNLPGLINPGSLHWEKTIPSLGDKSPEYAILHSDPKTHLTLLMFRTPIAVHIKPHTHALAETHIILVGGTHVFEAAGKRYEVQQGGYFRMPGGTVHEAWLPAGSQTLNILESGWLVDWVHGGPSDEDADKYPPASTLPVVR
jgi:hypothetical protein